MTKADNNQQTTAHTPEPWAVIDINEGAAIKDGRNVTIAYCDYATHADRNELPAEETNANARRICAAVNACEGISTEALERGAIAVRLDASLSYVKAATGEPIASCSWKHGQHNVPAIANSRLIAAAPEMFAALDELHSWLVCSGIADADDMAQSFPHMEELVRTAIATATGRAA
jgi:hypothetical protein